MNVNKNIKYSAVKYNITQSQRLADSRNGTENGSGDFNQTILVMRMGS